MRAERVVRYFGGPTRTAKAFKTHRQTVYHWLRRGLLPEVRARQAAEISEGALRFNARLYPRKIRHLH
jgi:DNA invertase Pin-like site-specific DNA recombinase